MCGISAVYGNIGIKKLNIKNNNQLKLITHRGPDFKKIKNYSNCSLGHTRLMIIDLDKRSNQPFENDKYSLLFNGMIYNYLEIKQILSNKYQFQSSSDTEVILAGLTIYGEKIFKMLRGMFSIVIYDKQKKELLCARDHLGIKPLYYSIFNNTIFIASEIKPILSNIESKPNLEVAERYFKFGMYESNENSFFRNINQFKPGYIYKVYKNLKVKKKKYWSLFDHISSTDKKFNFNESKEQSSLRIQEICNLYSRSDVKTGLYLSSGLDSTFLKEILEKKAKLDSYFTFGYISKYSDETQHLSLKKNQKSRSFICKFSINDYLKNLGVIQKIQEMPWGGPNVYFMQKLSQIAKKRKIKVMYNADGADEVFGGYKKYLNKDINENSENYFNIQIDGTSNQKDNILKNNFNLVDRKIKLPTNDLITNMRYLDIIYQKLPRNFRFSDRYSMSNSIELRYPFLDVRLIEDSFMFKNNHLLNKINNKILLRSIFKKYKRKKKHLNSPQINWINTLEFKNLIYKVLSNSRIFDAILDKKKTLIFVENYYKKKQNNSFKIWQILNYHIWLETFF